MPSLPTALVFVLSVCVCVCARVEQTNLRIIKYKLYASLFVLRQALGVNILKKLLLLQHVTYTPCMPPRNCSALQFCFTWHRWFSPVFCPFCHRQVTGCSQRQQMRDKWLAEDSSSRGIRAGIATFWQQHKENVITYALEQTTATTTTCCHFLILLPRHPQHTHHPMPGTQLLLLSRQQQFIWVWKRWINFTALCSTIKNYLLSSPSRPPQVCLAFGPNVRTGPELNCCKVVVA